MNDSRRFWITLRAALLALVVLSVIQIGLSMSSMSVTPDFRLIAVGRILWFLTALAALPLIAGVRRYVPIARYGWPRHLAALAAALTVIVLLQELVVPRLEQVIYGPVIYRGSDITKFIGEWLACAMALAVALVVELRGAVQVRELEARDLANRLSEARLQVLQQQLHPHFLFNTLTMISVLVHKDPAAADQMLTRLSDLLRATLRQTSQSEVSLAEELELLQRYLDIMRLRFGDRLTILTAVPAEYGRCAVPAFVLQPIVENALEHGIAQRSGPAVVRVMGSRVGAMLRLEILDDGVGLPEGSTAEGIGLGHLRHRLRQLHGDRQQLSIEGVPTGGTRVRFEVPWREGAS